MPNKIMISRGGGNNTLAFSFMFVPSYLGTTSITKDYILDFEIETVRWNMYTRYGYGGDYCHIYVATETGDWVSILSQQGTDLTPRTGQINDLKGQGYKKIRFQLGCQVANNQYVTCLAVAVNEDLKGAVNG